MDDYQRITDLRNYLNIRSDSAFAQNIGDIPQNIYDIKNGKCKLSRRVASLIHASYPNISIDWLLTGSGDMIIEEASQKASGIPLIPISAVAGFNGEDCPGVKIYDCERYCIPDFVTAGADYLIRVSGNSMYPQYSSGDILACMKIKQIEFIQWGKVYVIDSSQGAMVKRLYNCEEREDMVLCSSDNTQYPAFELPMSAIRSLSIVVGVIRVE